MWQKSVSYLNDAQTKAIDYKQASQTSQTTYAKFTVNKLVGIGPNDDI